MPYAILYKTDNGYFLGCEKDGTVLVKETSEEWIKQEEDTYNRFHNRGYEASMSACLFDIQFSPVVVKLPESIGEVGKMLEGKIYALRSIAGHANGWKVRPDCVNVLLLTAVKPRLISEETFDTDHSLLKDKQHGFRS